MARDAVAITAVPLNGGVARPAGTTINVSNGAYCAASHTRNLLLEVRNTYGSDRTVTIKAGVGPTAGYGDLVVTVAATSGVQLISLESARFMQADGSINIDFQTSMTGTVAAYRLPKGR